MQFQVDCPCGERIGVTSALAGGEVRCRCGKQVKIPSLSNLRRSAGQRAYATSTADRLRGMYAEGALPVEKVCLQCGDATEHVLPCVVECERPATRAGGLMRLLLVGLVAPLWIFWQANRDYQDAEARGRELVVKTPLRLCPGCAQRVRKSNRALLACVRQAELYAPLLDEYPQAAVSVG